MHQVSYLFRLPAEVPSGASDLLHLSPGPSVPAHSRPLASPSTVTLISPFGLSWRTACFLPLPATSFSGYTLIVVERLPQLPENGCVEGINFSRDFIPHSHFTDSLAE